MDSKRRSLQERTGFAVWLTFGSLCLAAACSGDATLDEATVMSQPEAGSGGADSGGTGGADGEDEPGGAAGQSDQGEGGESSGPAAGEGGVGGIPSGGTGGVPGTAGTPVASGGGGSGGEPATGGSDTGGAGGVPAEPPCVGDADFDGTLDCLDECPADSFKVAMGVCGCGVADTDVDLDGTVGCLELCPLDPAKTEEGVCGCGQADVDSDGDGSLDCEDACPDDAATSTAGVCGCGAPDDLPLCLRHRYSFDGTGAVAVDSVGGADGAIMNTELAGTGDLVLAGLDSDQYVDLPDGIISALGNSATFEVWLAWTGAGGPWQRIFDFGSSEVGGGLQGAGVTYLFLTPANTINTHFRAAFTTAGPPLERVVNGPTPLPFPGPLHVALVIDSETAMMSLYQDGVLLGAALTDDTQIVGLDDVNNWIGRSQFLPDEEFQGIIDEVRIYSAVRTAEQIAADIAAGPDALPAN